MIPGLFSESIVRDVLSDDLDRLFDNSYGYPYTVKYDQDNGQYIIEIALAGISKERISVKLKEGVLSVEISKSTKEENDKNIVYLHRGISNRSAKFTWQLSEQVDSSNITSTYVDGLLVIKLPIKQPTETLIAIQ